MRPASVFVRPLAPVEGQRLKRLAKQAKHSSTRQRAMILLASATEMSTPEIAQMWMTDESYVRKVIHDSAHTQPTDIPRAPHSRKRPSHSTRQNHRRKTAPPRS